jgi:tRNA modification GTPase
MDINGYPVIFTDTAGLRQTAEAVEKQGIERAYAKAQDADIVICLFDCLKNTPQELENIDKNKIIYVANKIDKADDNHKKTLQNKGYLTISAKYAQGVEVLLNEIGQKIKDKFTANSSEIITRQRYREALKNAVSNLKNFNFNKEIELSAEDIRLAAREIGKITGRIEVDEVLDKIFSSFCIGK